MGNARPATCGSFAGNKRGAICHHHSMRNIEGRKIGKDGLYPEMAERKGDVVYPTFHIGIQHLPEAKDWKIGSTYDITLRVKQTGVHISRNESSKKDIGDASFEILGIEPHGPAKKAAKTPKKPAKRYSRLAGGGRD
jgi:hypothetical protein